MFPIAVTASSFPSTRSSSVLTVRLKIRVRFKNGSRRFLNPAYSANGKLRPLYAMINGKAEHRPEGVYALRYLRCGVRVFESIGNDSQLALTAKLRVEHLLMGASLGLTEQAVKPMSSIGRTNLDESISEYLADTKQLKARSTHLAYSLTLLGFRAACPGAKYLEAITRRDILTYMDDLRKSGSAPRTIANRVDFLKIFFNRLKVAWPMEKTDKVKYTEKEVSAHNREEIEKLLGVADQDETDLLLFLLQTGAREKEVQFAC